MTTSDKVALVVLLWLVAPNLIMMGFVRLERQ
jgi:hypothetical protein